MQKYVLSGTPKRVKILDFQCMGLGHPATDIWSIVYSATDAEYRADHLEEDLQAYYDVMSTYLDPRHGCQMAIARFKESFVFGPSGLKDYGSATLRCKI